MFGLMNFPIPTDPHVRPVVREKDVPVVVFKNKEKKPVAVVTESKPKKVVAEVKPTAVMVEVKKEVKPNTVMEVKKEMKVEVPKKKIRFEKGSPEAMQFGKEMALRRKMKKEATMKEKVVEIKEEPEAAPVEVKA